MVVAPAVDPVCPRLEPCRLTCPVRKVQLARTEQPGGLPVEIGQGSPPGLHRPVRAVRRGARSHEPRELRAVVAAATARARPAPTGIVLAELNLRDARVRRARVDRPPGHDAVEASV